MDTGKTKVRGQRVVGVQFDDARMILLFADGRELHCPLQLYPTLLDASPQQRENWRLLHHGAAIHWPKLDLDLSVDGLIQGLAERIPAPPRAGRAASRRRSA